LATGLKGKEKGRDGTDDQQSHKQRQKQFIHGGHPV
jgi:hypothetical protein